MPAISQNWYDLNGVRGYPLDDAALGEDDAGRLVPAGLLVDCRLRFPSTAGRYAFLGALSVTPSLVTAIFMASDSPARPIGQEAGLPDTAVPIAAVTIQKPLDAGRHYPVEALYPGTGGWAVFGEGVEEAYTGRFASVRQSQILPRCARPYRPLPIPSIGKEFVSGPLTGLVKVLGGADVEVVKGQRQVHGQPTDCLVVRLTNDLNRNVFRLYAGPCAGRPESHTCPKPGLELLNTVGPDCDGNVQIEFRNVIPAPFEGGGGITLDLGVGLADACVRGKYVPGPDGQLPGEFEDLCSSESLTLSSDASSAISESSGFSESQVSEDCVGLPFEDGFDTVDLQPGWELEIGYWQFESDDSPEEAYGRSVAGYTATTQAAAPRPLHAPAIGDGGLGLTVTHTTDTFLAGPDQTSPPPAPPPPVADAGQVGWLSPLPPLQYAAPIGYVVEPLDRSIALTDTSKRNVLIWDDCGYDYSLGLTARTHLKMKPGTQMNGGLVINYHRTGIGLRPHYHLLMANAASNAFELWYYNGTNLSKMAGITMPAPWRIKPDLWYEVVAKTRLGATGKVVIEGAMRGVEQPNMPVANLSLAVTNYLPADGKFGIGTDRAYTLFSFFELKET